MQFLIHFIRPVTAAKKANVIQHSVFLQQWHAAGNDIDVVADGQIDKSLANFLGISRQPANGLRFALIIIFRHQRSVEIFGEKNKIALIIGYRIYKKLYLFERKSVV